MAGMGWRTTGDVAEFLGAAGGYLRLAPARHTVLLTVTEQLRVNPARDAAAAVATADPARLPLFGWWTGQGDEVGGAFMHTPPHPLLLTAVPAAAVAPLAAGLAGRPLRGVNAYPRVAQQFAAAWRARGDCLVTPHRRQRLYRLAELAAPDPAPDGAARVATDANVPLLTTWFTAFAREVDDMATADHGPAVRDKLGYRGISLWQAGGRPVSMGAVTRQVAGMVRIAPVYTPPEFRGRGYASAVTAELSLRAREAGAAEVVLYTDLDNPVSNSIYQRIGYRAVEDRVVLTFSALEATSR
jgi:ribosomal protein S18 acetylase RimI-like enzyme